MHSGIRPSFLVGIFSQLQDHRVNRTKRHELIDIVVVAICASICGAEGWQEISNYCHQKLDWLRRFVKLSNGVPSPDTFARVISRIDPKAFGACFSAWMQFVFELSDGDIIAIDGKEVRGARKYGDDPLHLVSAWAMHNEQSVCLGQVATDTKSNEIEAIPRLIDILDVRGCIVTIDAMGCQKKIVEKLSSRGAEYVITLKANQPKLQEIAQDLFASAQELKIPIEEHTTKEVGHGRQETRVYRFSSEIKGFDLHREWKNIGGLGSVERTRTIGTKTTTETSYYITSLTHDVDAFAKAVRSHWGIENQLHWVLDVAFSEDACRVGERNAARNLALIRKLSLNMMKKMKNKGKVKNKRTFKGMRKCAGWNNDFLLELLMA